MKICVFCSSKSNFDEATIRVCRDFAVWMGREKHAMVYGGASVGLMGTMADEVLRAGGQVEGYLPRGLFSEEVPHRGLTKFVPTSDLMERKRLMMENSDCFVILPGGVGTLDEFFEVLTWKTLECFDKPIALFNYGGFWNSLMAMMRDLQKKEVLHGNVMEIGRAHV